MPGKAHRPLTVGAIIARERGVALSCACGHRTALLPDQLAQLAHPETRLLDFKRRFRCSMCGRSGTSDEIRLKTFAVAAPFAGGDGARPRVLH